MDSPPEPSLRDVLNALKLDREERQRERAARNQERAEREQQRADRDKEREQERAEREEGRAEREKECLEREEVFAEQHEEIRLLRHLLEDMRGGVTYSAVATYLKENPMPQDDHDDDMSRAKSHGEKRERRTVAEIYATHPCNLLHKALLRERSTAGKQ